MKKIAAVLVLSVIAGMLAGYAIWSGVWLVLAVIAVGVAAAFAFLWAIQVIWP